MNLKQVYQAVLIELEKQNEFTLIIKWKISNHRGGIMINEDKKCNNLTGKEWLQNSFSIWRDLSKTKEEKDLKHPAS